MNTRTDIDTTTIDGDRTWAVRLLTSAVIAVAAMLVTPWAGIVSMAVIVAAGWRLRDTTVRRLRMMLWAAIGLATASVVVLTVGTLALSAATTR